MPGWCSSFRKTQIGGYGSRLGAIGPAEGRTRWLGRDDGEIYFFTTPISRKYFSTPG
jgi:hypothetical protein